MVLSPGRPDEGAGCVLRVSGEAECWVSPGWTSEGPWFAPDGVFVDVSAGDGRWCAVRADGAVVCWVEGVDGHEVLAESGFVEVSVGFVGWPAEFLVCALDAAGAATCWGDEVGAGIVQPPGGPFESVSAAGYRVGSQGALSLGEALLGSAVASEGDAATVVGDVCGVRPGGRLECWSESVPSSLVEPSGEFVRVAVGPRHACALEADGAVTCWGDNEAGQVRPLFGRRFRWMAGGAVCERDELGQVSCFSRADGGPIAGDDPEHPYAGTSSDDADPLAGPFSDVWVTDAGSCAPRSDGLLVCWGDPGAGFDPAAGPFTEMVAGRLHGCGLRPDGAVVCWALVPEALLAAEPGSLDPGQRRLQRYHETHWQGQDVPPDGKFVQLAAGENHTCALDENGRITCWGHLDGHGEPPDGTFVQLSAAGTLTCVLGVDETAACWGRIADIPIPPMQHPDKPVSRTLATASPHRPCMIGPGSAILCGQSATLGGAPWWVGPLTDIDARVHQACAIREIDEALVCWDPKLGTATVSTDRKYAQLAHAYSASRHRAASCTLDADGTIECEGTRIPSLAMPPAGQSTKIAISTEHGCAIRTDRTITCWGIDASVEIYE